MILDRSEWRPASEAIAVRSVASHVRFLRAHTNFRARRQ